MRDRIIVLITIRIFLLIAFSFAAHIPISSIEELQKIGNDPAYPLDGEYFLTGDIDASETINWNNGKGFKPIGCFTGTFNGQGHVIQNLYVNRPNEDEVGLFRCSSGLIENVGIVSGDLTGKNSTGALVGYHEGRIFNCYSEGKIAGEWGVGGLVGNNWQGIIEKSHASGKVEGKGYDIGGLAGFNNAGIIKYCYATGTVSGFINVGGLVGWSLNTITNCYSTARVSGVRGQSGGLVGLNYHKIEKCYATGLVSGSAYDIGGLIGISSCWPDSWYEVTGSFYDMKTTNQYSSDTKNKGIPKTTAEMMTQSTFTHWDFGSVWWMVPGKTYPILRPKRYIDARISPASWMPNPKHGLPVEFTISFAEPMRNFTFDDIDFTSTTLTNLAGTLTSDNGTTWTLRITDGETSPSQIVARVPLAAAMNSANYPCAATEPATISLAPSIFGDLNGDGYINEIDREILTTLILDPTSEWHQRLLPTQPDLNNDGILDIADLITFIDKLEKN